MILDRQLQKELLDKLSSAYPHSYNFDKEYSRGTDEYNKVAVNLYYLEQHELISNESITVTINPPLIEMPKITHKGLDFLADDGGLTAILKVVTIKFDADQLKAILESKIMASDLPSEDKQKLLYQLRTLPAEAIKHLTLKIVDFGWDNIGSLVRLIQNNIF